MKKIKVILSLIVVCVMIFAVGCSWFKPKPTDPPIPPPVDYSKYAGEYGYNYYFDESWYLSHVTHPIPGLGINGQQGLILRFYDDMVFTESDVWTDGLGNYWEVSGSQEYYYVENDNYFETKNDEFTFLNKTFYKLEDGSLDYPYDVRANGYVTYDEFYDYERVCNDNDGKGDYRMYSYRITRSNPATITDKRIVLNKQQLAYRETYWLEADETNIYTNEFNSYIYMGNDVIKIGWKNNSSQYKKYVLCYRREDGLFFDENIVVGEDSNSDNSLYSEIVRHLWSDGYGGIADNNERVIPKL